MEMQSINMLQSYDLSSFFTQDLNTLLGVKQEIEG